MKAQDQAVVTEKYVCARVEIYIYIYEFLMHINVNKRLTISNSKLSCNPMF